VSLTTETTDSTIARVGDPAVLGWLLMMIDSLWGAVAVLGIGFDRPLDIALDISLVAGLPAYALDTWSKSRLTVFLPALYLFRWLVASHIGPAPYHLGPPWRGGLLLLMASVLLQWFKLRKSAGRSRAPVGQAVERRALKP
jgi:hypothetical protein